MARGWRQSLTGKFNETFGKLRGSRRQQLKGKVQQAEGKLRGAGGKATDAMDDAKRALRRPR